MYFFLNDLLSNILHLYFLSICNTTSNFVFILTTVLATISHNVPAVYEVGGGIKGLCEAKAAANLPE